VARRRRGALKAPSSVVATSSTSAALMAARCFNSNANAELVNPTQLQGRRALRKPDFVLS
jgi:hypothetical protein